MDLEMRQGRGRAAFTLVEVLVAIVIIAVALGAVLNVYAHSLNLTVWSAQDTRALMSAYAQTQRAFFAQSEEFGSQGVDFSEEGSIMLQFEDLEELPLVNIDVGGEKPLRVYRFKRDSSYAVE